MNERRGGNPYEVQATLCYERLRLKPDGTGPSSTVVRVLGYVFT